VRYLHPPTPAGAVVEGVEVEPVDDLQV